MKRENEKTKKRGFTRRPGERAEEAGKKTSYATMPAEVHSRAITDARRGLNEWLRKPWAL